MNEKNKEYGINIAIALGIISVVFGVIGLLLVKSSPDTGATAALIFSYIGKFAALPSLLISIIFTAKDTRITSKDIFGLVISSVAVILSGVAFII